MVDGDSSNFNNDANVMALFSETCFYLPGKQLLAGTCDDLVFFSGSTALPFRKSFYTPSRDIPVSWRCAWLAETLLFHGSEALLYAGTVSSMDSRPERKVMKIRTGSARLPRTSICTPNLERSSP